MDCQNVIPYTIEACLTSIPMNLSRKVGIIDIKNDAFHEPIPGHQLNILWQNANSDLYILDHQGFNICLGCML